MKKTDARASLPDRLRALAFMSPRDIGLFLQSARTDKAIAQTRGEVGNAAAFDAAYKGGDPWASGDSKYLYQRRKYETLLQLLPDARYERALDIGAGAGHFSVGLATRADDVTAIDIAQTAVDHALQHYGDIPNLHFLQGDILALPEILDARFDLVVIADTIYYLPPPIDDRLLKTLATRTARLLRPGGLLLLCNHYFFSADRDSQLSRRIHEAFEWSADFDLESTYRRPFYLVSMLRKSIGDGTPVNVREESNSG